MFSETWPQDKISLGPQPENDLHDEIFSPSPHRDRGSWQNAPNQDQQPVSNTDYARQGLSTNSYWELDPTVQFEADLSKPFHGEVFDGLATDLVLSQPPAVGSCSGKPTELLVPLSSPIAKKRKRRRLSDSTKEKVKSVRRAGACLRCRVYKEPV